MAPQGNVNKKVRDGIASHSGDLMFPSASTSSTVQVIVEQPVGRADRRRKRRGTTAGTPGVGCPFCIVQDNDARVRYDGAWVLNSMSGTTTHSTTTVGSSLSLRFFGSGIVVYGTVPASIDKSRTPTASYTVDDLPPLTTTLARASSSIPNQQFFATSQKLSTDQHEIIINITDVADVPYIVSQFFLIPNTLNGTTANSKPLIHETTETLYAGSKNTIRVLSALLGTLIFLILAAGIVSFILLRKAKYRQKVAEKLGLDVRSGNRDTIYSTFTSPESILRADAGGWSPSRSSRMTQITQTSRTQSTRSIRSPFSEKETPPPLPPKAFFSMQKSSGQIS